MPTNARFLTLMQWLSPSFPISSFAYSHGLEVAIADGLIHDGGTLQGWLHDILTEGTGSTDAIWLRLAHASSDAEALAHLNHEARAFQPARHRLREAERQGAAFVRTLNAVWNDDLPELLLPLAVGAAAIRHGMDIDLVVPLYLHSFTSNLVAASQRLMALGQTDGQRILAELHPTCTKVAASTRGGTLDDIHSTAFLSDIVAIRHETLQSRLFQS